MKTINLLPNRYIAILWWKKLPINTRFELCKQYFEDRHIYTLTGREIQIIWESEKN